MRQLVLSLAGVVCLSLLGLPVAAQTPLDAIEQDLKQVKQQHDDADSQAFTSVISQLDAASRSPDAATALYQNAGGVMPDPTEVNAHYTNETPDEKAVRVAQDQDNLTRIANVVQMHCAMMRFAAYFSANPDMKGLNDNWAAWLKSVAQVYPQLRPTNDLKGTVEAPPADPGAAKGKRKRDGQPQGNVKQVGDLKSMTMHDSLIGKYLGYHGWDDKEQGGWAVRDIPKFYRATVLEPLRATPTADTLAAWDVYIAMRNADQPDPDKWAQVEYPVLQFDRGADAYAVTPTMDKLGALLAIIKANPTHPKLDDMIKRMHDMVQDYRSRRAPADAPAPAAADATTPPAPPNAAVSTTVMGDMTIVTTHADSNTAPVAPPQPAPAPAPAQ